jgi:carbon monoxide dehydrogenase subunit G
MEGTGFTAKTSYVLEPVEGGTRLTTTVESEYSLLVARLLGGLVTREAQKKLRADLARLEALVEAEAPDN